MILAAYSLHCSPSSTCSLRSDNHTLSTYYPDPFRAGVYLTSPNLRSRPNHQPPPPRAPPATNPRPRSSASALLTSTTPKQPAPFAELQSHEPHEHCCCCCRHLHPPTRPPPSTPSSSPPLPLLLPPWRQQPPPLLLPQALPRPHNQLPRPADHSSRDLSPPPPGTPTGDLLSRPSTASGTSSSSASASPPPPAPPSLSCRCRCPFVLLPLLRLSLKHHNSLCCCPPR